MTKQKSDKADKIIKNHMVVSMGAGLIPVPLLDVLAVTGVQLDMLRQLSNNYGIDFMEQSGKSLISAIGGSMLARMGASGVKALPIVGTVLGGVTMGVLSGASTYAIGQVFKEHFRRGGDFTNIDVEKSKRFFKEKFAEGKKLAKDLDPKQSVAEDKEPIAKSSIDQLAELAKMKNDGFLTEEEFLIMKTKIIESDLN